MNNRTELEAEKECFSFVLGVDHQDTVAQTINISTVVLNFVFSLCAIFENSILILTIWNNANLHRPSFVLLGCLGVSDLITGLLSQPCAVAYGIAKHYKIWTAACNATILLICSTVILSGVSVATLTAISIDRFLALHYHLRYGEIVTVPRVLIMFAGFWPMLTVALIPRFLNEVTIFTILLASSCTLCSTTILFCYWKIYKITKKHQHQIEDLEKALQHASGLTNDQIKIVKKSSISFFIVTVIFVGCMTPYLVFCLLVITVGPRQSFVIQLAELSFMIVMINASINPIVYCWRLKELRAAVKRQVSLYHQRYLDWQT